MSNTSRRFPVVRHIRLTAEDARVIDALQAESDIPAAAFVRYALRKALYGRTLAEVMKGWQDDD